MRTHFIGIKGISMCFLAELCRSYGNEVSGSDVSDGGHDAKNVFGADEVVYTSAIDENNVEYAQAKRLGLPLVSRAELLGRISKNYGSVVAICGTHGKTTTTAMLACALEYLNPTCHVGGAIGGKVGRIGGKELFITEACEYKENFLTLSPDIAVALNVQLDHADYYKTYENFYEAFNKFTQKSSVAFVCGDNEARTLRGKKTFTFGLNDENDYRAIITDQKDGYYSFSAYDFGRKFADVTLGVRGEHNVTNALAALAVCRFLGAETCGIEKFKGVDRRFESLGKISGIEYVSDYAHHPKEIECTLTLAKKIYNRVLVVFEPHTYSRTQKFLKDFVRSLSLADGVIILPIYSAREQPIPQINSSLLAREGQFKKADCYSAADDMIRQTEANFDCVIFMGAGTIDRFARFYVKSKTKNG